jgi:hypothetical protein
VLRAEARLVLGAADRALAFGGAQLAQARRSREVDAHGGVGGVGPGGGRARRRPARCAISGAIGVAGGVDAPRESQVQRRVGFAAERVDRGGVGAEEPRLERGRLEVGSRGGTAAAAGERRRRGREGGGAGGAARAARTSSCSSTATLRRFSA